MSDKKYEIKDLKQLCNVVNTDNIENLSLDLAKWLQFYAECIESIRSSKPEETKDKTNWEILENDFIWIDDGKSSLTEVILKDKDSGEIFNIKID